MVFIGDVLRKMVVVVQNHPVLCLIINIAVRCICVWQCINQLCILAVSSTETVWNYWKNFDNILYFNPIMDTYLHAL